MTAQKKKKAAGYDKYVDWKMFIFPVALFALILILPTPKGMQDVGTEYSLGHQVVVQYITRDLFQGEPADVFQWQLLTARMMEQNMQMGTLSRDRFLKRDLRWCTKYNIPAQAKNLETARQYIRENVTEDAFLNLMQRSLELRTDKLKYENLTGQDKLAADKGAWHIKVAIAMVVFVVFCFLTECIPLPAVAFCIGLILVSTGVVSRHEVAMYYWSDACWFIMGSLMFAAALVKTGVDKRVCLMIFSKLATPNVRWITLIFFVIIAPLASFISDHALAAMFLPIGMLLYQNSLTRETPEDPELAKMLMIAIAMACNIGGFGAPSGGARNVIMMTYLEDMFGFDIGYFQWVSYAMPFVIGMIPVTWLVINWRFHPKITSLAPAMAHLKSEIGRMGGWNRYQVIALAIFLIVLILYNFMDKSALGVSFRAIKVNESKMKFLGYDTFKIRWIGFSLASILSALAGSLYAINFGFVNPSLADPHRAAEVLVATLIGGAGTVFGPFFGTLAFLGIKDLVSRYIAHWELAVGILTLLVLFRFSKGIWGNTEAIINEKFGKKRNRVMEKLSTDKAST